MQRICRGVTLAVDTVSSCVVSLDMLIGAAEVLMLCCFLLSSVGILFSRLCSSVVCPCLYGNFSNDGNLRYTPG
jgi:hypothetical protein